jgi:hypothetical protein
MSTMTTENANHAARPEPKRPQRWSKRALRAVAWLTGGVAFAAPWGVLAISPKPAVATSAQPVQQVIIRRIIRHVYTQAPAKSQPKVKYVYAPAAAAPAPVAKSGGTHP